MSATVGSHNRGYQNLDKYFALSGIMILVVIFLQLTMLNPEQIDKADGYF